MPLWVNKRIDVFNEESCIHYPKINLQNKVSHQENGSIIILGFSRILSFSLCLIKSVGIDSFPSRPVVSGPAHRDTQEPTVLISSQLCLQWCCLIAWNQPNGGFYTTELGKCYKSGFPSLPPENLFLKQLPAH